VNTVQAASHRSRRKRVVLAVLVLSVGFAVVATAWWWRHPSRTFDSGYGIAMKKPVGATSWTPLEPGGKAQPGEIVITSIKPQMSTDGAAAVVKYVICDLDPATLTAEGVSGFGYGAPDKELTRYCTRVVPAEGASMRLGTTPAEELLVGVTPTQPGRTVIRSHRIEFTEGWQRGSANIHAEVVILAH
jgi:hypothetical protein